MTTKLSARFVIISNELPKLSDSSGALAGRMIMLQLTESFYDREDTGLTDTLLKEKASIFLWAIEGWRRLRERGYFQQPASSDELRQQMDELASPVGTFVKEWCLVHANIEVPTAELFSAWGAFCASKGREPGDEATFGRNLAAAVPSARRASRKSGDAAGAFTTELPWTPRLGGTGWLNPRSAR